MRGEMRTAMVRRRGHSNLKWGCRSHQGCHTDILAGGEYAEQILTVLCAHEAFGGSALSATGFPGAEST